MLRFARRDLLLAAALLLPACAGREPAGGQGGLRGTQKPYSVRGRTYRPLLTADGFREEGLASWYGPGFHGKRTANGEVYDQDKLTAAHKLLPMNTLVQVTNLDNGRRLTLRINDRGPFVAHRVIDLSREAARQLGVLGPGTAMVRVESRGPVAGATAGDAAGRGGDLAGSFFVQVGAFTVQDNALRLASALRRRGYAGTRVEEAVVDGTSYYRVQAGEFPTLSGAWQEQDRLADEFAAAFVVAR